MAKIIVLGAMKGGVGKSVSTYNLAYSLKKLGQNVLVVDFDSSANITRCVVEDIKTVEISIGDLMMNQMDEEEQPNPAEYIINRNGVDFVPSSKVLSAVDAKLRLEMGAEKILACILEPFRDGYDYILIDTCPSLNTLTINALAAADEVIIAANPQFWAMVGLEDFLLNVKGAYAPQCRMSSAEGIRFIESWNKESYDNACVHAFIDGNDDTVYQTLPWNHRGWHCASGQNGSGNNTHIGVEMCEPACIKYTGGATFTCSDVEEAKAVVKRTYEAAVELFAMLCKEYGLNPLAEGVIISHVEGHKRGIASNHGDPEHLWNQLSLRYTMDGFRKAVKVAMTVKKSGFRATEFVPLSKAEVIAKIGALFTADQKKSGILASVSLAQFILESGYGKSEFAQNANNCLGMKKSLSGNTWSGSSWDGVSVYTKQTKEQNADGSYETITADFRA